MFERPVAGGVHENAARLWRLWRPIDDDKPVFRSVPENDEIVDHAALVVKEHPVTAGMDRHVADGHGHERVEPDSRQSPWTRNSPIWQVSKSVTALRVCSYSARIPSYCTGISHPPNGTMRALRATCSWYSGGFV